MRELSHVSLPIAIVGAAIGHVLASVVVARRRGTSLDTSPSVAFVIGLVVVAAVVMGPLDVGAEQRLSWHMVQHLGLISVAAPLLVLGHPIRLATQLLGFASRRARQPDSVAAGGGAVFSLTVLFTWHIPTLYQLALRNELVHGVEHITLLGSAMLLWSALLQGRDLGAGVLWLYFITLPMTALGVAITIARTPWYWTYVHGNVGAAVRDQQLAGVIMWGFGGLVAVVSAVALFATWLMRLDAAPRPDVRGLS